MPETCGDDRRKDEPNEPLPVRWPSSLLGALLTVAILGGAAVLRLVDLDNRPMHCDEAVHAVKFGRLLEEDDYVYDPREYHGPSLNFLTLPIARAASARRLTEISENHLRLLPAILGIALVGLVWLVRDALGRAAALWAALLTAVSPALVFYSRYYIQEMLLVFFTFAAMVALWRFAQAGGWFQKAVWLVLFGLCVGMMHATKETCVIALFAMAVAAALTMPTLRRRARSVWVSRPRREGRLAATEGGSVGRPATAQQRPATARGRLSTWRITLWGLVVAVTAGSISALLFSSFLDNPRGVVDSYTTYFHYLGRASGEGSVGRHVYPPDYYFRILFWWRQRSELVWSEEAIAALALAGLAAAALGKGLHRDHLPAARFLSVYTLVMVLVYCALPYKTPWCALSFLHGMILLAGLGAAVLVRAAPGLPLKGLVVGAELVAAGHLVWLAHLGSFTYCDNPNNPYVYAHTTGDVPLLAERVRRIAAAHPDGRGLHVQVVCPDDDYWPLPWYLRDFSRVGWFGRVPRGLPAPLIITQPEMEADVLKYLYQDQPPGRRHLYVPVPPEQEEREWQLRPNVPLRLYARLDLWEAHQAGHQRAAPP